MAGLTIRHMTKGRLPQLLTLLVLSAAVSCAIGIFATVTVAPCDPSLPILSDGTRQAPGSWAKAWLTLMFASAALFGLATGLSRRFFSDSPMSLGKLIAMSVGTGVAALVILWIAGGVYWQGQCPT